VLKMQCREFGKTGRDVLPLLTALPFSRQKKLCAKNAMPGIREDGKRRFSHTLPPYRFPGKKNSVLKIQCREFGKTGRNVLPLLTALPFSRQKNAVLKIQCREVGKGPFSRCLLPYRFPGKKYTFNNIKQVSSSTTRCNIF